MCLPLVEIESETNHKWSGKPVLPFDSSLYFFPHQKPKSEGQGLTLGVCWNLIGHDGKISSVAGLGPKKAAGTGDADDQISLINDIKTKKQMFVLERKLIPSTRRNHRVHGTL